MNTTETAELDRWREAGKAIGRKLGAIEERERIIQQLESRVCWECAETKPTYAHNVCANYDEAIELIKGEAK